MAVGDQLRQPVGRHQREVEAAVAQRAVVEQQRAQGAQLMPLVVQLRRGGAVVERGDLAAQRARERVEAAAGEAQRTGDGGHQSNSSPPQTLSAWPVT